ncbi:MAG: phytoene/squalene synthase family protein [Longispora sp.]|nr:phytoene/squalene synthase family protein [Longispora sp. (in: high G+C Gram-positive bacteria)]
MQVRLAAAYETCRQLHRRHGRTYYLASSFLPANRRKHVHALYGFARYTDDLVDQADDTPVEQRAQALREWQDLFTAGLDGTEVDDPILPAVLDTVNRWNLDPRDFSSFFTSMAMDLSVTGYQTYDDLLEYMEGSAAVIGTMTLPLLNPSDPALAREPARQLGLAFQLTNFIRDVGEDTNRGRVYLPVEDLNAFHVTRDDLREAASSTVITPNIRELIAHEICRAREHYAAAAEGIPMLSRGPQTCVRTAFHVYEGILREIERRDYDIFTRRAVVPPLRRLRMATRCLLTRTGTPVTCPAGARKMGSM